MSHHSRQSRASVGIQTDSVPAATHASTASLAATYAATPAPLPVIENGVFSTCCQFVAPALVIEYVSSAPAIEYIAPAPAMTLAASSQQLPLAYTMTNGTTDDIFDITGLVKPQFFHFCCGGFSTTGRWFISSFRRV